MPELPEVETTCRGIAPLLIQQTIDKVAIYQASLRQPVPDNLNSLCSGQRIQSVTRRAKYILIQLDKGCLLIHLGMTGHLRIIPASLARKKHDHIDVFLQNSHILRYHDPRRFGSWQWIEGQGQTQTHPSLIHLGVEPLQAEFTAAYLKQACSHKKQPIKSAIMDNRIVVGVGNIYASESLFLSRIHPSKAAGQLLDSEYENLVSHIRLVLQQAIKQGGTTLKDFFNPAGKPGYFSQSLFVYARKQQPCLLCNTKIECVTIGGRSSCFCPSCQAIGTEISAEID